MSGRKTLGYLDMRVTGNGMLAFIQCPAIGVLREVSAITFKDRGVLTFPHDFSARAEPEHIKASLPKISSCEKVVLDERATPPGPQQAQGLLH